MHWMVPPPAAQALRELQRMARRAPGRVSRRAQALVWCLSGISQTAVAERLGVSRQSVGRWCRRFRAAGPAELADRRRFGRPPCLDAAGQRQLRRLLVGSDLPETTGPGGWTAPQLAEQLGALGWPVSAKTVRCWAVRLGARWRRGRLVAKGDPERQAVLERLAAEVQAAHREALRHGWRLVVVFEDEADLALLPHAGSSWQLVDQPASIPTPGQNEKVALFGSLSLEGELVITEAPRKTARLLTEHLEQVAALLERRAGGDLGQRPHSPRQTHRGLARRAPPGPPRALATLQSQRQRPRAGLGLVTRQGLPQSSVPHLNRQARRRACLPRGAHPRRAAPPLRAHAAPEPPVGRRAPAYTGGQPAP